MALSDSEWLAWLEDETKRPVILVEANYYDSTEKTLYLSDAGYRDPEDVDAPNYLPVVIGSVVVDRQLDGVKVGAIDFTNYDDDILEYQFMGFDLKIFYGDKSWPKDDFRQRAFTKTNKFLSPDPFTYRIETLDGGVRYFDQPIKTKNGSSTDIGLPMVFGSPFNMRPLKVSSTTFVLYAPSNMLPVTDPFFPVRDGGELLTPTTDYTVAYNGEDVDKAGHKYTITLAAPAVYEITCDPTPSSSANNQLFDIVTAVNGYIANSITIDTSLEDYDGLDLGYVLYDFGRLGDFLLDLFYSVGANPRVNLDGELEAVQIGAPATASRTVTKSNFIGDIALGDREPKLRGLSIGYRKNWYVQSTNLAAGLDAGENADQTFEYRNYAGGWTDTFPEYPLEEAKVEKSMLTNVTDANSEFSRRNTLRAVERRSYSALGDQTFMHDDIGDTVEIVYPHYGLSSGDDFIVLGITEDLSEQNCTVKVWH